MNRSGRPRQWAEMGRPELLSRAPRSPAFEVFIVIARAEEPLTPAKVVVRLRERGIVVALPIVEKCFSLLESKRLIIRGYRVRGYELMPAVRKKLEGKWPD